MHNRSSFIIDLSTHTMGTRMLLMRVRITASACPNTHFSIVSLPPQTHPLRVWTGNGLDNRRAAGKWNKLNSLAPQPVAAATATQGTYGQSHPQGLGGWETKDDTRVFKATQG